MKKIIKISLAMVLCMITMVGCSNSKALEVSGSTSIAPLMEKLKEKYKGEININADGSSAGIKAVKEGVSDIGMSSRELKDDEKKGVETNVIALDAIAVITNKNNKVKGLTKKQLQEIYSGKITNWKEVGGKDLAIVVTSREEGSGTRTAFEEILGLLNDDNSSKVTGSNLIIMNSTGSVLENVTQKEGAIGYISLGSVDDSINTLEVDKVMPSEKTVKDKKYLLSRNFNIVTKDADEATKAFVDFILGDEGQKIIKEQGFITVK